MAAAVWILGDSEAEIRAALTRLRLEPAGRLMPCAGRARFMQRAEHGETEPGREQAEHG